MNMNMNIIISLSMHMSQLLATDLQLLLRASEIMLALAVVHVVDSVDLVLDHAHFACREIARAELLGPLLSEAHGSTSGVGQFGP